MTSILVFIIPCILSVSQSCSFGFLSFLILVFVLQWLSLCWIFRSCCLHWLSIKFTRDALFHGIAYDYSRADWNGFCGHLRDVPLEDIFKLGASAAASEFCEWVQVGIDVYIPHKKYQVKPPSPWFSAVCTAAILHRNDFFRLNQKDKSFGKI